ncbi:MAG: hypothetical protein ACK5MT_15510 [Actinomycetales bacterium]
MTDPGRGEFGYSWDADGVLTGLVFPNGVRTTVGVDNAARPVAITTGTGAGQELLEVAYAYDQAGQRTGETTTRPVDAMGGVGGVGSGYEFDGLGRLNAVSGTGAGQVGYTPAGAVSAVPGGVFTHTGAGQVAGVDRSLAAGRMVGGYAYDARGNRTSASMSWTPTTSPDPGSGNAPAPRVATTSAVLTFDGADRVTGWVPASAESGPAWSYTYAAGGLRRSATTVPVTGPADTRQFTWSQAGTVNALRVEMGSSVDGFGPKQRLGTYDFSLQRVAK